MRVNLSQLEGCGERWEDMTSAEGGRICRRCRKTIVDFRDMTAFEIGMIHARSAEPVCGLYTPEQLVSADRKKDGGRSAAGLPVAFTLAALLQGATPDDADAVGSPEAELVASEAEEPEPWAGEERVEEDRSALAADTMRVHGIVRAEEAGEPIAGAMVVIEGTDIGALTGRDGEFELWLERELGEHVVLAVRYIGYGSERVPVKLEGDEVHVAVALQRQPVELTAFYVTAGPARRPWWEVVRDSLKPWR